MTDLEKWVASLGLYKPIVWPPKDWDPILVEIARIVFSWNEIERIATQILNTLIGGEHRAIIATAHMGSSTQMDALRTLASEFLSGEEQLTILHLIQVFERLRERRNYYVHSFNGIGGIPDYPGPKFANLGAWSARGRLKRHEMRVEADHLASEAQLFHIASHYFALVHNHFKFPDNADYQSLPEKFPLPDRLTKPSLIVLGDQLPPQPSPR